MAFLTPQASALAGLRYAPNHWNAHHKPSPPRFNPEDEQTAVKFYWGSQRIHTSDSSAQVQGQSCALL